MVSGLLGTFHDKLKELKLNTLEDRRIRADAIQTYKIVHGVDKVDRSTWFQFFTNNVQTTQC